MSNELPEWWTKAKKIWVEDDAMAPDREQIGTAWKRWFGVDRKTEVKKESYDAGDAEFVLYESGRVACLSYPGNNEIRLYEPLAVKVFCKCVGCGREHQVWSGQTVPPGWRAFTAAHWPAGNDEAQALGPLYLRICGACVDKMDRGPVPVVQELPHLAGNDIQDLLDEMRDGWTVAVHNDYKLGGVHHTFWLFTHPSGRYVKGEGRSDGEALAKVVAAKRALEDGGFVP